MNRVFYPKSRYKVYQEPQNILKHRLAQIMKSNVRTKIVGRCVILVPYKKKHVPKYHDWMKSRELQQLTASEPLSLEEEYRMQETWLIDEDKCTFIVLDKCVYTETNNEISAMIGDTNLFLLSSEAAEVEIMIAETSAQGKGCGKEALQHMLKYGCDVLGIKKYVAKIGINNQKSINLFTKFGFSQVSKSDIFEEITFEKFVTHDWEKWLRSELCESYEVYVE